VGEGRPRDPFRGHADYPSVGRTDCHTTPFRSGVAILVTPEGITSTTSCFMSG
jgi:hypothetical protein